MHGLIGRYRVGSELVVRNFQIFMLRLERLDTGGHRRVDCLHRFGHDLDFFGANTAL